MNARLTDLVHPLHSPLRVESWCESQDGTNTP
jgi:hypothetical protein